MAWTPESASWFHVCLYYSGSVTSSKLLNLSQLKDPHLYGNSQPCPQGLVGSALCDQLGRHLGFDRWWVL